MYRLKGVRYAVSCSTASGAEEYWDVHDEDSVCGEGVGCEFVRWDWKGERGDL